MHCPHLCCSLPRLTKLPPCCSYFPCPILMYDSTTLTDPRVMAFSTCVCRLKDLVLKWMPVSHNKAIGADAPEKGGFFLYFFISTFTFLGFGLCPSHAVFGVWHLLCLGLA